MTGRCSLRRTLFGVATLLVGISGGALAQRQGLDPGQVALAFHKLTNTPIDLQLVAQQSELVRRASNFERPDALKAEVVRLQGLLAAADPGREFVVSVNDNISEYDHDRGEFSITLFTPGYFLPIDAFGQQYQVVFANAAGARAIPMAKEEARTFDARLNEMARGVLNEIHFRVIGSGDPAGAVTGARVVRAQIISARLLDREGRLVFAPKVGAVVAATGTPATAARFDIAAADVAGFKVGVRAKDLEATLNRLVGKTTRQPPNRGLHPAIAGMLGANDDGCYTSIGRRVNPDPGAVCVSAWFDGDDIVRVIRVERLFSYFDGEVFRKTLTDRYGGVASAASGGDTYSLSWGPEVDPSLVFNRNGPHNALGAYYTTDTDFMSRGGNALPRIRVVLQLVDAGWASQHSK